MKKSAAEIIRAMEAMVPDSPEFKRLRKQLDRALDAELGIAKKEDTDVGADWERSRGD